MPTTPCIGVRNSCERCGAKALNDGPAKPFCWRPWALRTKRIHDELVTEKPFARGDWVLVRHKDKQKLEPQWFGPYKVLKAHPAGTYALEEPEGRVLSNLVNGSWLVKATVGESSGTLWTSSAQAEALKQLGIK
ncbi:hypothetical protein KEM55_008375, partial [Ascosphaera atra]